jgi:hypothetical protein
MISGTTVVAAAETAERNAKKTIIVLRVFIA